MIVSVGSREMERMSKFLWVISWMGVQVCWFQMVTVPLESPDMSVFERVGTSCHANWSFLLKFILHLGVFIKERREVSLLLNKDDNCHP